MAAHPDDETIGASLLLKLSPQLLLVHVTDGAPPADAKRAGFHSALAYAAARRRELDSALRAIQSRARCVTLDVPDQGASDAMHDVAQRLRTIFAAYVPDVVVTHPYEGGHPDHDATAFAVARASSAPVFEMTSYHARPDGGLTAHAFLPGPPALFLDLTVAERARKHAMFDCFATQTHVLAGFSTDIEGYRRAPRYDYLNPPHAGRLYYEQFDWGMTGARWRDVAACL